MLLNEIKDFAQHNVLDAKGGEMPIPNVYREKEYGKGYKTKVHTVEIKDKKTGKVYGRRSIHQRSKQ